MSELIDRIALFIEEIILLFGYPGVFLALFTENVFPPIPTDPILPFAGILVSRGEMRFVLVWLAAIMGAVSGSLLLYGVGIWADERVMRRFIRQYGRWFGISEVELDRSLALFARYGLWIVLVGRSLPFVRSVIPITAAMSGMPVALFATLTAMSAAFVTGFYITLGYILGENWRTVLTFFDRFDWLVILALGIAALVGLVIILRRFPCNRRTAGTTAIPTDET